jgi:proteasome component ECM29
MAFVSGAFGMFREGREGAKESMRELVAEGKANERATLVLGMFDKVVKALEE